MSEDKKSFVMYRSWALMIRELSNEQAGDLIKAVCRYLDDPAAAPEDPTMTAVFAMIKAKLDEDADKYADKVRKRKEAAEKRWKDANAMQKDASASVCIGLHGDTDTVAVTDTDTVTGAVADTESPNGDIKHNRGAKRAVFVPPTVEEVEAYCFERNNRVNAEEFVDFYSSKGWMIGKNKMKDWRAAVRTWERSKRDNVVELTAAQRQAQERHEVLQRIMRGEQ